jgi:hypothetical protein
MLTEEEIIVDSWHFSFHSFKISSSRIELNLSIY